MLSYGRSWFCFVLFFSSVEIYKCLLVISFCVYSSSFSLTKSLSVYSVHECSEGHWEFRILFLALSLPWLFYSLQQPQFLWHQFPGFPTQKDSSFSTSTLPPSASHHCTWPPKKAIKMRTPLGETPLLWNLPEESFCFCSLSSASRSCFLLLVHIFSWFLQKSQCGRVLLCY